MVDMDGLKGINDQFGHRYGDTALIEIADFNMYSEKKKRKLS